MRLVTTQKLIDQYGPGVKEVLAPLGTLDVLPNADYNIVKIHCDTINEEILLVGGPEIVPYGILANPTDDPDEIVPTDNPYACTTDPLFYVPNKVIGRLPTEAGSTDLNYLKKVVANQLGYMKDKSTNNGWLNVVASVWVGISNYMKAAFGMADEYPAPPFTYGQTPPEIGSSHWAYLNLHGSDQTPYFYGQQGDQYPIALAPTEGHFKGCMVFTEACYGGKLAGRTREQSIPMMALYSGAVSVVCSTNTAYGPANPPPEGADLLFQCFANRCYKGEAIGAALMHAKQDFAAQLIQRIGNISPSNKKTMLQFHLLGVPTIVL